MRRRQLILVALAAFGLFASSTARAQQPMTPYPDEPQPLEPMPAQPMAPMPPPIVVPPPGGYYQQPCPYPMQPAFHEELQPNYGLVIAGSIILGASWSINAGVAYLANEWKLAVPVVGPFMETANINTGPGNELNRMAVAGLVFDGLIETAGAAMIIAGAVTHHRVRVYDPPPRVSVVPTVVPAGGGLAAFGRF